jgi:hypothetical protein
MSDLPPSSASASSAAPERAPELLFANLVSQQANMALLFLGRLPTEDGTPPSVDLRMAGLCIDTLEMLASRTRGNLTPPEQELLARSLTDLRMAFVEAADQAGGSPAPEPPPATSASADTGTPSSASTTGSAEGPKRFVKKY